MNHAVHCRSYATADIGLSERIGSPVIIKGADRLKYGCGAKAYA